MGDEEHDTAAVSATAPGDLIGHVERLDEVFGIAGWVVDPNDPMRPITLELWAGDRLMATTATGEDRPDVCAATNLASRPGFSFSPEALEQVRGAAAAGGVGDLSVRVAGQSEALPSIVGTRSLEAIRLRTLNEERLDPDTFLDRLSAHAQTAQQALSHPMRPLPDRAIGYVELVSTDDAGLVWLIGWIKDDGLRDRPVVVIDTGRHAAGFAYCVFDRADLPPGAKGFVGVLHTDWRPVDDRAPLLFMADGSLRFLEVIDPIPFRSRQMFAPYVHDLLAQTGDDFREVLGELFRNAQSWSTEDQRNPADMVRVDELAILPGFGALVKGWMLSPSKEALRFTLRDGNRIIVAEPRSVARHERPDVAGFYPNMSQALGSAGFVAIFRNGAGEIGGDGLVFKATWHDGSSSNEAVSPTVVRILGLTASIDSARRFYPTLEAEVFFPEFAIHAARHAQARARAVQVYEAQRSRAVVILGAPDTASDLFLMVDRAIRHASVLPPEHGIAIVARDGATRALLLALFADLKRATGRACSLFFTRDTAPTNDAVEAVADALGADHFTYVGPNALLTEAGWAAAAEDNPGLTLFAIADPVMPADEGRADLTAFGADRATWQAITKAAAPRIGGIGLSPGQPFGRVAEAAISLGQRRPEALVQRINQAIGAHHG